MAPGPPPPRSAWTSRSVVSLLLAMTAALGPTAGAAASPSPRTSAAGPSVPSGSATPATGSAFTRAPGTRLPHGAPPSPAASPPSFSPAPQEGSPEAAPAAPGASVAAVPAPAGRAALTRPATIPPVAPSPLTPTAPSPLTPTGPSLLTPTGSPPVTPFATPSGGERPFAGRPAGEGRVRPGRSLSPRELAEAIAALEDEDTPDTPSAPTSAAPLFPSSEPVPATRPHALGTRATEGLRRLSLGSGIALVGLGLAFLGARMRRAD